MIGFINEIGYSFSKSKGRAILKDTAFLQTSLMV